MNVSCISLNIFCMVFALVPAIGFKGRLHSPRARGSLFLLMAVSVILMLALENLTMGLDDLPHPPRMGIYIANAFYFILHPLPSLSFILYADYLIAPRQKVFGPVALLVLGYTLFNTLLIFPIPAIAGSVLQLAWQGMNYIWPGACVSLLILYVQMQMRELNEDYLTSAFNRRYLDYYLASRMNTWTPSRGFAGLMIDMDDFKGINDRFGHTAGDRALVVAVEVVRRALRHMDVIARFAGDEFVVVLEMGERADYQSVIARIYQEIGKENRERRCACPLSFSIGGAVYSPVRHRDAQAFFRAIDQDMYREKLYRKALVPALGE